jgi:hypothetical protein
MQSLVDSTYGAWPIISSTKTTRDSAHSKPATGSWQPQPKLYSAKPARLADRADAIMPLNQLSHRHLVLVLIINGMPESPESFRVL